MLSNIDRLLSKVSELSVTNESIEKYNKINIDALSIRKTLQTEYKEKKVSSEYTHEFKLKDLTKEILAKIIVTELPKLEIGESEYYITLLIEDKKPIVLTKVVGYSVEIMTKDFDLDGIVELRLTYPTGGHSMGMLIYKIQTSSKPKFVEGSDIGSDYPLIETKDIDNDGEIEIVRRQRDWENVPVRDYYEYVHKIRNSKLIEVSKKHYVFEDDSDMI